MKIIAGPCQHESLEQSLEIATECKRVCDFYEIEYYFKASYDKANRSHNDSPRGLGFNKTFQDFTRMKQELPDLKIVTDFHTPDDIYDVILFPEYGEAVDVIQIPALLSRQTDLIKAAATSGKIVNIKKGQFMAPWDVPNILSKVGGADVWITERGTSFGYNNLVVDFTGIDYLLKLPGFQLVFDGSHAVQKPSGLGNKSGGNRDYVSGLLRAAAAMGVENFFMEVHPDPDNALSDGPNSLKLSDFSTIVNQLFELHMTVENL